MLNEISEGVFQIAVSASCFVLLFITTVIFIIYFVKTKSNVLKFGSIVSFNVLLFVFFKASIIFSNFGIESFPKDISVKVYEFAEIFLIFTVPFFLLKIFRPKDRSNLFFKINIYLGLAIAVFFTSLILTNDQVISSILFSLGFEMQAKNIPFIINDIGLQKIVNLIFSVNIFIVLINTIGFLIEKKKKNYGIYILLGLVAGTTGIYEYLPKIFTGNYRLLTNLNLLGFIPCLTVMMLFFFAEVFKRFFYLKKNPDETIFNYEKIVEVADEMLFTLSPQLDIIAANERAKKVFQINNNTVNFISILYIQKLEEGKDRQFWKERIKKLKKDGDKLSFNTHIKNGLTSMPAEYHFRFDCYTEDKIPKLIGRAWPIVKPRISKFIDIERLSLTLDNNIALAENIAETLTATLRENLEEKEVLMLRTGLYEIIVNAIEHGNLGITTDNKIRAEESGYLFDFINDRQKVEKYKDKKVFIDYYYNEEKVVYRVTDMGMGFDYENTIKRIERNSFRQEGVRHSGILMALSAFDLVEYNKTGNQVLLTRKF